MVVARKALTGTVGFVVTMASDAAPVNAKGLVATLLLLLRAVAVVVVVVAVVAALGLAGAIPGAECSVFSALSITAAAIVLLLTGAEDKAPSLPLLLLFFSVAAGAGAGAGAGLALKLG